ncbi:hybrid signal transduction histidine kinase M [Tanacetum coccineum]|uniref:Hybrid signal transduction histidine kinase M n=1 Tax=Tanacetum coccineum TaxID=301880 RepID=A0ABQ5IJB5_9ASTR
MRSFEYYSYTPPPPPPPIADKLIPFSIANKVPVKLNLEKHNYISWSSFFTIHLGSFGLKPHIEDKASSSDPEWCKLDDIIKMWILESLCDSLQEQVVSTPGNVKDLWDHLEKLFHDNKNVRAINLDNELRSLKIGNMSINDYYTKLKFMADRLKNLRSPVSEKNLVIYVVNGLNSHFATIVEIIHREPLPSFETTQNKLLLKESTLNNVAEHATNFDSSTSSPTILMATKPKQKALFHADWTLSRYKARLVANGSSQQLGIDCDETFSPVVKPATIHTVLSLARSLYGLKQAPHAWFKRFVGYAIRAGFYHSRCDSLLFILRQGSQVAYSLINVDDIILTTSSNALFHQIITSLHQVAIQLRERAHMTNYNPSRILVDIESIMGPKGVLVQDPTLYRSLAGGLQYLTFTRPYLSYAVQQLCLYMHDLREPHLAALKRILRYGGLWILDFTYIYLLLPLLLVVQMQIWTGCPSTR